MRMPIIGTGTAVYDVLLKLTDFPGEERHVGVIEQKTQGGGMTATAMVAVARLGQNCAFFGNLGDDENGQKILQGLVDEGVNVDGVEMLPGYVNTVSYVLINSKNGSRTFLANKENTPPIELTDIRKKLIENASVVHMDGGHYESDVRIAQYAREKGVTVSYDACRGEREAANNCRLLPLCDIVITCADYPEKVCGKGNLEDNIKALAQYGSRILITTLGSKGCAALINDEIRYFPAYKVDVVDTTGAGDVFHGSFLYAYNQGLTLEECIRFASATAAIKCTKIGGRSGIPTAEEVNEFIKTHPWV